MNPKISKLGLGESRQFLVNQLKSLELETKSLTEKPYKN
jgi:hypothetical protein